MAFQEYPKWVNLPDHKEGGQVVFSKEEEDGLQGKGQTPTEEVIPDFLKSTEEPKRRGRPRKE